LAFRHALRVSELVDIRRQQIDLDTSSIHVRRAKNGTPGIHGLQGDELRLLRALRRGSRLAATNIAARLVIRRLVELGPKVKQSEKLEMDQKPEGSARDYRGSDLPDLGRFAEAILLRRRLVEEGEGEIVTPRSGHIPNHYGWYVGRSAGRTAMLYFVNHHQTATSGRAARDQDFSERSALDVVAGGALINI
jgi:hypothetical protein